ncbi:hypothetical protein SNE40_009862 [Patella caerulea]|uniref:Uncharacterized protein n=1 Tax=Patella caerulea TaxID=87958 RepID=A0AAN8JQH8_PATCE
MHRPMYSSFSIDALMAPQPRLHPPFYYPGYMFMPPSALSQNGLPDPRSVASLPLTHPMFSQAHILPHHPGAEYLFNPGLQLSGSLRTGKDSPLSGIVPKPGALNAERSVSASPVNSDGEDDMMDRHRGKYRTNLQKYLSSFIFNY